MRRHQRYELPARHQPYHRDDDNDRHGRRERYERYERRDRAELERVQNELRESEQQRRALSRQLAGRERACYPSVGQTVTDRTRELIGGMMATPLEQQRLMWRLVEVCELLLQSIGQWEAPGNVDANPTAFRVNAITGELREEVLQEVPEPLNIGNHVEGMTTVVGFVPTTHYENQAVYTFAVCPSHMFSERLRSPLDISGLCATFQQAACAPAGYINAMGRARCLSALTNLKLILSDYVSASHDDRAKYIETINWVRVLGTTIGQLFVKQGYARVEQLVQEDHGRYRRNDAEPPNENEQAIIDQQKTIRQLGHRVSNARKLVLFLATH